MKKIVIGLSGGMDSTTLLGLLLEQGFTVHCVSFLYGSKHSPFEIEAAYNVVRYYRENGMYVEHSIMDLRQPFLQFRSNLLTTGGPIPEGHYESDSMRLTVVPGRNLILSSLMAGLAESIEANYIGLGVHSGDHHIYPDCREEFIVALGDTIKLSTEGKVDVIAPLLAENKHTILKIGYDLKISVPYHLTRTCYKDSIYSCGKCGSCVERLEAFSLLGIKDPIKYITDEQ